MLLYFSLPVFLSWGFTHWINFYVCVGGEEGVGRDGTGGNTLGRKGKGRENLGRKGVKVTPWEVEAD